MCLPEAIFEHTQSSKPAWENSVLSGRRRRSEQTTPTCAITQISAEMLMVSSKAPAATSEEENNSMA